MSDDERAEEMAQLDGSEAPTEDAEEEDLTQTESIEESDADAEEETDNKSSFLEVAQFGYRDSRCLALCTLIPLFLFGCLMLTAAIHSGIRLDSVASKDHCAAYTRVIARLADSLAEEARLRTLLGANFEGMEGQNLTLSLAVQQSFVDRRLRQALQYANADSCKLDAYDSVESVITEEGLANFRAQPATVPAIFSWYRTVTLGIARAAFVSYRKSLSNFRSQRHHVSTASLQLANSAIQSETVVGKALIDLLKTGSNLRQDGSKKLEWHLNQGQHETDDIDPKVVLMLKSMASATREAGLDIADILMGKSTGFGVAKAIYSRGSEGRTFLLDEGFTPVPVREVLSADQRQAWMSAWVRNASRVNHDLDTISVRLVDDLSDSLLDADRSSRQKAGTDICIFLLVAVFIAIIFFLLRSFVRDTREEEKIQVDFEDDEATLAMLRMYCSRMGVWLLEDIPRSSSTDRFGQMGQMELNMCQAVNALRPLRPFVPPWVFVNRPPRDSTEGAKYVEKPKYKQPSIDLTAEMAKVAVARGSADRTVTADAHASALASFMDKQSQREKEQDVQDVAPMLPPSSSESPAATPIDTDVSQSTDVDKKEAMIKELGEKKRKEMEDKQRQRDREKARAQRARARTEAGSPKDLLDGGDTGGSQNVPLGSRRVTVTQSTGENMPMDEGPPFDADSETGSIPQVDNTPPPDPETVEQDLKDMSGLQRTLNLSSGLHLRNDVSLVEISLRNMHSTKNHQKAPPGANYRSPAVMAKAMNTFLMLVAEVAERHQGAIARISPAAVHVGFNLTWYMDTPALCAKAACSFTLELVNEYDNLVKALRVEEADDVVPPLEVGSKVEMRVRGGPWLEGEVTQLKPLRVRADGEQEAKPYAEVRPASTMCSLEQGIGSPEKGGPTIAIVTGNMFAGIVNTGTFRTFEFVGPHVTQLMKLRCINDECGIRVLVDSWTRAMYLRAPLMKGDTVVIVHPAERLQRLCQEADKGLGWNDAMARGAGTRRVVLAVNSDGTVEVELDDTSARFPASALRHSLFVHQVGILHNDSDPWDTRHCEIYSEIVCNDVSEKERDQQHALDQVFAAVRTRRYRQADRLLQNYIDDYETEEIDDPLEQSRGPGGQGPQEQQQQQQQPEGITSRGDKKTRVNISNSTHRLKEAVTHLVEAATAKQTRKT